MSIGNIRIDWRAKLLVGLVNLVIWFVGYFWLNRRAFDSYFVVPSTALDVLPLLPWTITLYLSSWVYSAAGIFLLPSGHDAR